MVQFKAEVCGCLVTEELVGVGDDGAAGFDHAMQVSGAVGAIDLCRWREVAEPVEAPFEGSDDAIGIPGRKCCLPLKHPLLIEP